MKFEWDDNKSSSNQAKHGISFEDAKALWNDPLRIEIETSFPDENRSILIGKADNKIWTAVFTVREESIRIISVRRARKGEASLYDQK